MHSSTEIPNYGLEIMLSDFHEVRLWLSDHVAGRKTHPHLSKIAISYPQTYKYVCLHGRRDFVDVVKPGILRCGDHCICWWAQHKHKCSYWGKKEAGKSERDGMIEAKVSHVTAGQRTHAVSRSWKHQGTTCLEPPRRNTALLPPWF